MAANGNLLHITTPTFTRVINVQTLEYSHYPQVSKEEDKGKIAEIVYPQGKVALTRQDKTHVVFQNTSFSAYPKQRKQRKRPLVQLDLGKSEDRFFEDGTIVHGFNGPSSEALCKVSVIQKEDGSQEVTVSYKSIIPPPSQTSSKGKNEEKTKNGEKTKNEEKMDNGEKKDEKKENVESIISKEEKGGDKHDFHVTSISKSTTSTTTTTINTTASNDGVNDVENDLIFEGEEELA